MSAPLADIAAERSILGTVLSGNSIEPARILAPADFYAPTHDVIWEAMLGLATSGQPLDHLTVSDRLKSAGKLQEVGGPSYLMQLDEQVPLAANLPAWVAIVRDRSLRRMLVANARQIAGKASNLNEDASGAALAGSAALASLGAAGAVELQTMEHALSDLCDDLQAITNGTKLAAVPSGVDVWDEVLGGIQLGRLTCIGAYPSVGKSALKGAMVQNLARAGIGVGLFELEDPREALARRWVSLGAEIPVRRLASERLPEYLMDRAGAAIQEAYGWARRVVVDDRSGLTASQVAATARQMVVQRGCKVLFVDHAGEMKFDSGLGRYDLDVSSGIRMLRDVAKDLNVAVILLAHFHRPKTQTDKEPRFMRPTSAMWKNSGGFEEAARVAVGLWMDPDLPGGIVATVLKQTEGEKDIDFWMPMHQPSGLVNSIGGRHRSSDKGYSEAA